MKSIGHNQDPKPIYTPDNCNPSYKLIWSLTLFWREPHISDNWLNELKSSTEKDGVRILNHRTTQPRISQFLISTKPAVSPRDLIKSVKGRLQYIIREINPKAFQRNYFLHSIGAAKREVVEEYVAHQLDHHRMADHKVQAKLSRYQIRNHDVDLSQSINSAHGKYIYNLHLVVVNVGRWVEIRDDILDKIRNMIIALANKQEHRLSAAGIFPDHIHIALGCSINESPQDVALGYLNNLAYAWGMKAIYQSGYYVGTFGEYDTGAIG